MKKRDKMLVAGAGVVALIGFIAYRTNFFRQLTSTTRNVVSKATGAVTRKGVPITPEMAAEYNPNIKNQVRMF